jgi:hypothetical protein
LPKCEKSLIVIIPPIFAYNSSCAAWMSEGSALRWRDRSYALFIRGDTLAAQIQNEIYIGKGGTFPLKALISTPMRSVNGMA